MGQTASARIQHVIVESESAQIGYRLFKLLYRRVWLVLRRRKPANTLPSLLSTFQSLRQLSAQHEKRHVRKLTAVTPHERHQLACRFSLTR
jgi:hypothetical protein